MNLFQTSYIGVFRVAEHEKGISFWLRALVQKVSHLGHFSIRQNLLKYSEDYKTKAFHRRCNTHIGRTEERHPMMLIRLVVVVVVVVVRRFCPPSNS